MMVDQAMPTPTTSILIVDDDRAMTELLHGLLTKEGYQVEVVHSLADAAASIAAAEPDVVLLDIQMPDGSGLDLCLKLHSDPRTVDLPILLLSAIDHGAQFVAHGLDLGGYDFLPKPFFNDELLARVRVLVRLRKLQQRLIEQEREKAMLATAGAAAHTLGQPLMAALGLVKLLLSGDLNAQQREDAELLHTALRQMTSIVHQIQEVQHYITQPYLDESSPLEILDLEQARGPRPPHLD